MTPKRMGALRMKGRTVFAVVGWGLMGLTILGFLLSALWRTYKNQPMTYLGALASFGVLGLVGLVALYYRLMSFIEKRRDRRMYAADIGN